MAPGAEILLDAIGPFDFNLIPKCMTRDQWIKLANAFHEWHFKPDVLEDETYLEDNMLTDYMATIRLPGQLSKESELSLGEQEDAEEALAVGVEDGDEAFPDGDMAKP